MLLGTGSQRAGSEIVDDLLNLGFTGHTETWGFHGVFPPLPTTTVEVNRGDRTASKVFISVRVLDSVMGDVAESS